MPGLMVFFGEFLVLACFWVGKPLNLGIPARGLCIFDTFFEASQIASNLGVFPYLVGLQGVFTVCCVYLRFRLEFGSIAL